MIGISEKDILDSIKQKIENETPDVWGKIQDAEKCKYEFDKEPLNSKKRRAYLPAAVVALCAIVTFAGLKIKIFDFSRQNDGMVAGKAGQNYATAIITPGIAEDSIGRDVKPIAPDIFKPFTKDADANEAAKALKFGIVIPTWMPEGFTKVSSKLFSNTEDGSQPYMYNIEYNSPAKKLLTVSISKNMTEEEKLKAQPAPMPVPVDKGPVNNTFGNNVGAPEGVVDLPAIQPDTPSQSVPGYNPSQPAAPPTSVGKPSDGPTGKPTPQDGNIGSVSTGSAGTAPAGKPVSVEFTSIKVKGIDVSMTVTSSSEHGALSAFWVYNSGSYNIYTDGISKNDMIKIIESMII